MRRAAAEGEPQPEPCGGLRISRADHTRLRSSEHNLNAEPHPADGVVQAGLRRRSRVAVVNIQDVGHGALAEGFVERYEPPLPARLQWCTNT